MKPVVTFEDLAKAAGKERGVEPKEKFNRIKYQNQYNAEHYENIQIQTPKDMGLRSRVRAVARSLGMSSTQFIIRAIEKELALHE